MSFQFTLHQDQGDQIGRVLANWVIVFFVQIFEI
jgi:hypothetical protein